MKIHQLKRNYREIIVIKNLIKNKTKKLKTQQKFHKMHHHQSEMLLKKIKLIDQEPTKFKEKVINDSYTKFV